MVLVALPGNTTHRNIPFSRSSSCGSVGFLLSVGDFTIPGDFSATLLQLTVTSHKGVSSACTEVPGVKQ